MATLVALLRAINLGGRSMPMAGLREMLADLGLGDPRTVLQSGNAVFESSKAPDALEALLEKATVKRFALSSEYFVRTAREWDAIVAANPFEREAQDDPSHLLVMALKDAPKTAQVAALVAAIKGPERVAVDGRQAYIVYPDGIGRSKLTNSFIEARLGTRGTGRNWSTAQKIAALARGGP